jgi:ribonuclease D
VQYWERRPLRQEALTYCASDVAYLFALERKLQAGLEAHKKKVDKVRKTI